jgi:hypothetical protein
MKDQKNYKEAELKETTDRDNLLHRNMDITRNNMEYE